MSGPAAGPPGGIDKVNLSAKFETFSEHWSPKIVAEVNDAAVKLAKLRGEFVWHHHEQEDELFLVLGGTLRMLLRDAAGERELRIEPGEFVVIPRGVEHCPVADEEVHLVLIEPKTTLNTGNVRSERTIERPERI